MNLGNCDIIYSNGSSIYGYVFSTNIETNITSFFDPTPSPIGGICHTTTKLWIYDNNNEDILEYNITLTPFLATYNRTITLLVPISGQLTSIDNNTLISSNYDDTYIIEIGISGSSGVITNKFPINPGERAITTNFLYVSTPTPKLIYGTYKYLDSYYYITQLDYTTGNIEFDKAQVSTNIIGLFTDSNELYFVINSGNIYIFDRNSPYFSNDFIETSPSLIYSLSQPPICGTTSITPQPQPPTCDNNCVSYVKAIFLTGGDVEYVTYQGDTIITDIGTLPIVGDISTISNTDCIDFTTLSFSDYPYLWDITEYGLCCPAVTPVIPVITGFKNECGVITILPMNVTCETTNPTSFDSSDGQVSVLISGGTPPYVVTWDNGSLSQGLTNLKNGSYTATTVDYYKDYTSVTVCEISTSKDCSFSGSSEIFIPPSPTPTKTPTNTPTPTPTKPPANTPTPTPTKTLTPTPTPTNPGEGVLDPFDYIIVTYEYTPPTGVDYDLDTFTTLKYPSSTISGTTSYNLTGFIPNPSVVGYRGTVGCGTPSDILPNGATVNTSYLAFGGDDANQEVAGSFGESVVINFKNLESSGILSSSENIIIAELYAGWHTVTPSYPMNIKYETYSGGTITKYIVPPPPGPPTGTTTNRYISDGVSTNPSAISNPITVIQSCCTDGVTGIDTPGNCPAAPIDRFPKRKVASITYNRTTKAANITFITYT